MDACVRLPGVTLSEAKGACPWSWLLRFTQDDSQDDSEDRLDAR